MTKTRVTEILDKSVPVEYSNTSTPKAVSPSTSPQATSDNKKLATKAHFRGAANKAKSADKKNTPAQITILTPDLLFQSTITLKIDSLIKTMSEVEKLLIEPLDKQHITLIIKKIEKIYHELMKVPYVNGSAQLNNLMFNHTTIAPDYIQNLTHLYLHVKNNQNHDFVNTNKEVICQFMQLFSFNLRGLYLKQLKMMTLVGDKAWKLEDLKDELFDVVEHKTISKEQAHKSITPNEKLSSIKDQKTELLESKKSLELKTVQLVKLESVETDALNNHLRNASNKVKTLAHIKQLLNLLDKENYFIQKDNDELTQFIQKEIIKKKREIEQLPDLPKDISAKANDFYLKEKDAFQYGSEEAKQIKKAEELTKSLLNMQIKLYSQQMKEKNIFRDDKASVTSQKKDEKHTKALHDVKTEEKSTSERDKSLITQLNTILSRAVNFKGLPLAPYKKLIANPKQATAAMKEILFSTEIQSLHSFLEKMKVKLSVADGKSAQFIPAIIIAEIYNFIKDTCSETLRDYIEAHPTINFKNLSFLRNLWVHSLDSIEKTDILPGLMQDNYDKYAALAGNLIKTLETIKVDDLQNFKQKTANKKSDTNNEKASKSVNQTGLTLFKKLENESIAKPLRGKHLFDYCVNAMRTLTLLNNTIQLICGNKTEHCIDQLTSIMASLNSPDLKSDIKKDNLVSAIKISTLLQCLGQSLGSLQRIHTNSAPRDIVVFEIEDFSAEIKKEGLNFNTLFSFVTLARDYRNAASHDSYHCETRAKELLIMLLSKQKQIEQELKAFFEKLITVYEEKYGKDVDAKKLINDFDASCMGATPIKSCTIL